MATDVTPCLREMLGELDRLRTPLWVVDLERGEKWWCNRAGLVLWNAADLAAWIGRNATNTVSEATLTRMHNMRRRFERGEVANERWTFYPDGAGPVVAEVQVSGIVIADAPGEPGRMAMLVEARPLRGDEVDPSERRGYEALRYLGEPVSYYGDTGEALMRNPAAIRTFGDCGTDDQLRASLDPVTGKYGVLVTQRDITERRAHLEELERRGQLLAAQAEALRHLAAPVMRVGPGVLALPLIGALDRERVEVALAALLARTGREPVTRVVLDLTGAAAVDLAAADGLLRIVRVLQLQGVTPALSGIHPELARAIVAGGLELGGVRCFQSMADALSAG